MTVTTLMTAEELLQRPDDGMRHELVRGELTTMAPASARHSVIALHVGGHLAQYVREHRLGTAFGADCGFVLARDPDTVRAPDAAFARKSRAVNPRGFFEGAPDLAIEVISPNDLYSEVREKVREYLAFGTQLVIVVDPRTETAWSQTRVQVCELTVDDSLEGGDVVPGWSLPLRELFA